MPSGIKTSSTFFCSWLQREANSSHYLFVCTRSLQRLGMGENTVFFLTFLEPHFTLSLQCWGMLCIHSFHISCLCYFLCSFIRLSNELMVFQLHSAAVQRAASVTGNIWCNLCVDKWVAEFPGCKAYGHNSVWAGPGRAPFFGCQVAGGQACGGAVQSAPSNWNVDQSAGTAPCLIPFHRSTHSYTHVYMSTHSEWSTAFCVFS